MASIPTAAEVVGGFFVLAFVAFALYGIVLAQVYEYVFSNGPKDSWYLKGNVIAITFFETLHTCLALHFIYHYSISKSGDLPELARIIWSGPATVLCEAIMVVLVHSFYIRRIWIMSGQNKWLVGMLISLLITRTAFSICTPVLMYIRMYWVAFRDSAIFTVSMSLSLLAAADFAISSTLIFYLWRSRTGHGRTDHLIRTLMAYCVNSGFITMIFSFLILIMFLVSTHTLIFGGLVQVTSKLYANSFLGSLNMRRYLREQPDTTTAINLSTFHASATRNTATTTMRSDVTAAVGGSRPLKHIKIYQETSSTAYTDTTPISPKSEYSNRTAGVISRSSYLEPYPREKV
ncbi:hypothetical protein BXZ70DRAFT_758832 [Cristinia sonorae]|uniref:DUF6534 domain-containing protein n=1 Tax=Cristinia sonorae TaxID=1940300 RepID=A0A8K0UUM7_9AGAR|nr:hypothetical protein BXZ70DRAFT_758832 [Cristinia sonorae]